MTLEDRKNITYRRQWYRSSERRLEITPDQLGSVLVEEERENSQMEEGRDDGKEFSNLLLMSMQELTKRIKEMGKKFVGDNKQREIPREFEIE